MNSTGYYRIRAEYYRRAAGEADNSALREQFGMLAADYDELAERSEHGLLAGQKLNGAGAGPDGAAEPPKRDGSEHG